MVARLGVAAVFRARRDIDRGVLEDRGGDPGLEALAGGGPEVVALGEGALAGRPDRIVCAEPERLQGRLAAAEGADDVAREVRGADLVHPRLEVADVGARAAVAAGLEEVGAGGDRAQAERRRVGEVVAVDPGREGDREAVAEDPAEAADEVGREHVQRRP